MSDRRRSVEGGESLDALVARLRRRFRTRTSEFSLGGRPVSLLHPESAEDLIDERAFEQDERLPYWAEVWPSARILGGLVSAMSGAGRSLLELGCGAGLVATAAGLAGFDVVATDYYEDALLFTRANVWRHTGRVPGTRLVDWRRLPTDLGRHDLVVASDVLYEREYGALVARALDVTLASHGEAMIADPGRLSAGDFLRDCATRGIRITSHERLPFADGDVRQTINVYRLRRG